jgi:hypothetical protein
MALASAFKDPRACPADCPGNARTTALTSIFNTSTAALHGDTDRLGMYGCLL